MSYQSDIIDHRCLEHHVKLYIIVVYNFRQGAFGTIFPQENNFDVLIKIRTDKSINVFVVKVSKLQMKSMKAQSVPENVSSG